ncbi:hypothetical protein IBA8401_01330 [Pseudomonas syringae]
MGRAQFQRENLHHLRPAVTSLGGAEGVAPPTAHISEGGRRGPLYICDHTRSAKEAADTTSNAPDKFNEVLKRNTP